MCWQCCADEEGADATDADNAGEATESFNKDSDDAPTGVRDFLSDV